MRGGQTTPTSHEIINNCQFSPTLLAKQAKNNNKDEEEDLKRFFLLPFPSFLSACVHLANP